VKDACYRTASFRLIELSFVLIDFFTKTLEWLPPELLWQGEVSRT
jgi:hypothetical protein